MGQPQGSFDDCLACSTISDRPRHWSTFSREYSWPVTDIMSGMLIEISKKNKRNPKGKKCILGMALLSSHVINHQAMYAHISLNLWEWPGDAAI